MPQLKVQFVKGIWFVRTLTSKDLTDIVKVIYKSAADANFRLFCVWIGEEEIFDPEQIFSSDKDITLKRETFWKQYPNEN